MQQGLQGYASITSSAAYIYSTNSGPLGHPNDSLLIDGTATFAGIDYNFNTSSGDLTINTKGLYEVTYGSSASTSDLIYVAVNGSSVIFAPSIYVDGINSNSMVTGNFIINLNPEDVLRLRSGTGITPFSASGTASAYLQLIMLN